MSEKILEIQNLKKYFPVRVSLFSRERTFLKAVDGVTFSVDPGETFGLVGESGCGKTTIGKVILKLYEATDGKILFEGEDVTQATGAELTGYRKCIQAVFQNPYASLDPRMRIWRIIAEPLKTQGNAPVKNIKEKIASLIDLVGLPSESFYQFPHELSAGQRQQAAVARALAINPKFIVFDEPTSLLDVSAQASILNLIVELQEKLLMTYIFISHNLAVVEYLSNRVAVMYCGRFVEVGDAQLLYNDPKHPYTKALLSSVPVPDPAYEGKEIVLEGDVMSPIDPPPGCRFFSRCQERKSICQHRDPPHLKLKDGRYIDCHLFS